eukprot:symbB.v1.2.026075.t1/scaffold2580.1/size77259/1
MGGVRIAPALSWLCCCSEESSWTLMEVDPRLRPLLRACSRVLLASCSTFSRRNEMQPTRSYWNANMNKSSFRRIWKTNVGRRQPQDGSKLARLHQCLPRPWKKGAKKWRCCVKYVTNAACVPCF